MSAPTLLERFLRYVQIDTQSDPFSNSVPSTEKQRNLGNVLVEELQALGLSDAHLDQYGYVYATLPANTPKSNVPTICFCSHMDTSPDSSGAGVKPIVHSNYNGQDLVLPDDPTVVIRTADHPHLAQQLGNDIVTASGTTLLGADNKAGLAAIMNAVQRLQQQPGINHGAIKILFTPDEEIGRGVDHVDMEKLGADFGYTIDGEQRGSLEDETFSADALRVDIQGISAHPGFAKGRMVNALKVAGTFIAALPKDRLSPETTEGREGFVHPVHFSGSAEAAQVDFILRDFDTGQLAVQAQEIQSILDQTLRQFPGARATVTITEQYRNMKEVLRNYPQVVAHAETAIRRAGMEPIKSSIRGGTDGSRLSFMGLPCPNLFAGEHAFHSKQEWVSVQDMEKASEMIVELVKIWEEESE